MSIRLKCRACQTAFLASDDMLGRVVNCPKCNAAQKAPATVAVEPEPKPAPASATGRGKAEKSVFVPRIEDRKPSPVRKLALAVLALLLVAGVTVVAYWPMIQQWLHPVPPDPIEVVARDYLTALSKGDVETTSRLGVVEDPPAIRSIRGVKRDRTRDTTLKGSFAPIAALNARIDKDYTWDPSANRFVPRNALGPAAETLDALHDAKTKAEADEMAKKIASGNPDDIFDAAEGLGKTFNKLAEGVLSPRKLIPTYKHLIEDSKPPLPPAEKELALDFGDRRATWDALLKRPVRTLKSDGPYILDRAEVRAQVMDKLASSGDPPTKLRLELVRFRLEGIDTQWKVVSAQRDLPPAPPAPATVPTAPPRSYETNTVPK